MKNNLKGVFTALLTPFNNKGEVDLDSLRELINFVVDAEVNGLQILGSTGLSPLMSQVERKQVAEAVVESVSDSIQVIIHVGAADTETSLYLAKHAKDISADAITCVTPYYYTHDDESIFEHYRTLASAVDLPIFIYNIPRYTGYDIPVTIIKRLAEIPNIVGIKDSSRDFSHILDILQEIPEDFTLFSGPDKFMFSSLTAGATGCISAIANVFPEICVNIYRAAVNKDYVVGKKFQAKLNAALRYFDKPLLSPLFETLRLMGLKSGYTRLPLRSMSDKEKSRLEAGLERIGLLKI